MLCINLIAGLIPAGGAGFDPFVEGLVNFSICVRKGAYVVCRVRVGCVAFAARRRCDAVRVAVVRLGFGCAAADVHAVAVMQIWIELIGQPIAPVVGVRVRAAVGCITTCADRRAHAGRGFFWGVLLCE